MSKTTPGITPAASATPALVATAPEQTPVTPIQSAEGTERKRFDPESFDWSDPDFVTAAGKRIKRKVKIDKDERELTIDELGTDYQLREASNRNMRAAAESRKQVNDLLDMVGTDPITAFKRLSEHPAVSKKLQKDFKTLIHEYVVSEFELDSMTPEQRELHDLRRERDARKKADDDRASQEKAAREEAEAQAAGSKLEQDIVAALKTTELPMTESVLGRVIEYLEMGLDNDVPISAAQAVGLVEADVEREQQERLAKLSPDKIKKMLGPDGLKALQEAEVADFKKKNSGPSVLPPTGDPVPRRKSPSSDGNSKTIAEVFRELREQDRLKR